ncbi:MAG: hypothetical protein IKF58_10675, partial [Bacillus sp. (in: Bacteria)]|nr:hypothetical protein [Bacillus sp. (in: firmicutes)]
SERRLMTARVCWWAVARDEITSNRLKARNMADGHQRSERRIMTAQASKRAVASDEISSK